MNLGWEQHIRAMHGAVGLPQADDRNRNSLDLNMNMIHNNCNMGMALNSRNAMFHNAAPVTGVSTATSNWQDGNASNTAPMMNPMLNMPNNVNASYVPNNNSMTYVPTHLSTNNSSNSNNLGNNFMRQSPVPVADANIQINSNVNANMNYNAHNAAPQVNPYHYHQMNSNFNAIDSRFSSSNINQNTNIPSTVSQTSTTHHMVPPQFYNVNTQEPQQTNHTQHHVFASNNSLPTPNQQMTLGNFNSMPFPYPFNHTTSTNQPSQTTFPNFDQSNQQNFNQMLHQNSHANFHIGQQQSQFINQPAPSPQQTITNNPPSIQKPINNNNNNNNSSYTFHNTSNHNNSKILPFPSTVTANNNNYNNNFTTASLPSATASSTATYKASNKEAAPSNSISPIIPSNSSTLTEFLMKTITHFDNECLTVHPNQQFSVPVHITAPPVHGKEVYRKKTRFNSKRQRQQGMLTKITSSSSTPLPEKQNYHNKTSPIEKKGFDVSSLSDRKGPAHLVASQLPPNFPPELAYRALSVYSIIRTLSIQLRLSPFTSQAFLRALSLSCQTKLLGSIHVSLLRFIFAHQNFGCYCSRGESAMKIISNKEKLENDAIHDYLAAEDTSHPMGGHNLIYLDHITWPLYYYDYANFELTKDLANYHENAEPQDDNPYLDISLMHSGPGLDQYFQSKPSKVCTALDKSSTASLTCGDYTSKYPSRTSKPENMTSRKNYILPTKNSYMVKSQFHSYPFMNRYPSDFDNQYYNMKIDYLVSEDVKSSVDRYIMNGPNPSTDHELNSDTDGCTSSLDNDEVSSELMKDTKSEENDFCRRLQEQFQHLKYIKNGSHYHELSVDTKLTILEYLVDKLFEIDIISREMSSRFQINGRYPFRYGNRPESNELSDLVNQDECSVCGLDGELLCCDGCTASYHRGCVNISQNRELGDGEWLCLECTTVDVAKLGPLHGGSKSSLDWFTLADLEPQRSHLSNPHTSFSSPEEFNASPSKSPLEQVEFLIINGYVFARHMETKQPVDIQRLIGSCCDMSDHDLASNKMGLHPLSPSELYSLLSFLGEKMCSRWPWCQVPFDPKKLWEEQSPDPSSLILSTQSKGTIFSGADRLKAEEREVLSQKYVSFIANNENVNPGLYVNKYFTAPLIFALKEHTGSLSSRLDKVILDCSGIPALNHLTWDMSSDTDIARLIPDPMKPIRQFLVRLEESLKKAHLLTEGWILRFHANLEGNEERKKSFHHLVTKGKSVTFLSRLLVDLIDNTHANAFFVDWNHIPGLHLENQRSRDSPNYVNTAINDWKPANESIKRKWEQCQDSDIYKLLHDYIARSKSASKSSEEVTNRKRTKKIESKALDCNKYLYAIDVKDNSVQEESSTPISCTPHSSKKCSSAYNIFVKENYSEIKSKNENISHDECTRMMSSIWKNMSSNERAPYYNKFQEEKRAYLEWLESREKVFLDYSSILTVTESQSTEDSTEASRSRKSSRLRELGNSNDDPLPEMLNIFLADKESFPIKSDEREKKQDALLQMKISRLQNLLRQPYEKEEDWPVAGRKLFVPEGSMPKPTVKWLGRNAGMKTIPHVMYCKFEIGLPAVSHVWRSRTLRCISFEQLVHQVAFLDSYIDRSVITSMESVSRSSKDNKKNCLVSISQRNLISGEMEYFVQSPESNRGSWFTSKNIDKKLFIKHHEHRCLTLLTKYKQLSSLNKCRHAILDSFKKSKNDAVDAVDRRGKVTNSTFSKHEVNREDSNQPMSSSTILSNQKECMRNESINNDKSKNAVFSVMSLHEKDIRNRCNGSNASSLTSTMSEEQRRGHEMALKRVAESCSKKTREVSKRKLLQEQKEPECHSQGPVTLNAADTTDYTTRFRIYPQEGQTSGIQVPSSQGSPSCPPENSLSLRGEIQLPSSQGSPSCAPEISLSLRGILIQHENDIKGLMQRCASLNKISVPASMANPIRERTRYVIQLLNTASYQTTGVFACPEDRIDVELSLAENRALTSFLQYAEQYSQYQSTT